MNNQNQDSRYLTMWICVIVVGALIFVGWLWTIRHSIDRTNAELSQGVGSMEQMTDEMQKMFNEMSAELKKTELPAKEVMPKEAVEPSGSAPVLKLELPAFNEDKK